MATPSPADFVRQTDTPRFPDIFWNRPTIKSRSGRLLIVGGQRHEFSLVQGIYQMAEASGIGWVQAAMPDSLRRLLADSGFGWFLPSTASGSLGRAALAELLHLAEDYDGTVIGANLTNNSETGILVESLLSKTERPAIVTQEAISILKFNPALITGDPHALVVTTMTGLFELANNLDMPIAIRPNAGVLGKLEVLSQLASISRCSYLVFDGQILVSAQNRLGLTPMEQPLSKLPAIPVGIAATFWLQNQSKPFESLMTAAFMIAQTASSKEEPTITSAATATRRLLIHYEK